MVYSKGSGYTFRGSISVKNHLSYQGCSARAIIRQGPVMLAAASLYFFCFSTSWTSYSYIFSTLLSLLSIISSLEDKSGWSTMVDMSLTHNYSEWKEFAPDRRRSKGLEVQRSYNVAFLVNMVKKSIELFSFPYDWKGMHLKNFAFFFFGSLETICQYGHFSI